MSTLKNTGLQLDRSKPKTPVSSWCEDAGVSSCIVLVVLQWRQGKTMRFCWLRGILNNGKTPLKGMDFCCCPVKRNSEGLLIRWYKPSGSKIYYFYHSSQERRPPVNASHQPIQDGRSSTCPTKPQIRFIQRQFLGKRTLEHALKNLIKAHG